MPIERKTTRQNEAESLRRSVRITVTFSQQDYEALNALARKLDVSTSWVVRKAAEKLLSEQQPLFRADQPFD